MLWIYIYISNFTNFTSLIFLLDNPLLTYVSEIWSLITRDHMYLHEKFYLLNQTNIHENKFYWLNQLTRILSY